MEPQSKIRSVTILVFIFIVLVVIVGGLHFYLTKNSGYHYSFTATYQVVSEDKSINSSYTQERRVWVSGNLYKIVTEGTDVPRVIRTVIYDGKHLYENNDIAPYSQLESERASELDIDSYRFWQNAHENFTNLGNGEPIAGRQTDIYEAVNGGTRFKTKIQLWVDRETGVLLKSMVTVMTASGQTISFNLTQCEKIEYGPVDDSEFQRK